MGLLTLLSSYTTVSSIKQWENRPLSGIKQNSSSMMM